ncbi:hypothetical protein BD414DRAFT_498155 [Trametes punicea]|nr:hypothetical protein BD414DRAFT_498155 [Trametes punicea]
MSLDQNLFTLNVSPRADDRNLLDLADPNGLVHYTKRRLPGTEYRIELIDPLSESVLAAVTAPSPTSKHKTIQLYNPDIIVELKYTGTLHFKWGFRWEEHDFEWRREECYILRKPDPAVLVAITKEPPGRLQTRSVQLLDYNLNRFDINDRKGLEVVILTALLTFQDMNETYHSPRTDVSPSTTPSESTATLAAVSPTGLASRLGLSRQPSKVLLSSPPEIPPKPAPRTGVERVAELHAIRTAQGEADANEVEVGEECDVQDYAQYAERLLNDEAMLFITIRSASAAQVPKVLRVVEETKRLRHKSGLAEDEELYQYVIYDTRQGSTGRKGPKRINLDDPDPKNKGKEQDKYAPPTSLTIHLSKIDMPELQPKAASGSGRRPSETGAASPSPVAAPLSEFSDKERRRAEKESKKPAKESKKTGKEKAESLSSPGQPNPIRLTKPLSPSTSGPPPPLPDRHSHSSSFLGRYHVPPHQAHPYQPSPSPSQLNNPMIYAAPPPPQPPNSTMAPSRYRPADASAHVAFPMPATPFYSPTAGSGYNAMPPAPPGGMYQPGYSAKPESGKPPTPSSSSSGKGPVTTLLEMWSKH